MKMNSSEQPEHKVVFRQPSSDGDTVIVESVWASKLSEHTYVIKNIPFYARLYSVEDLVRTELINDEEVVTELITASGNSTIRVVGDIDDLHSIRTDLQAMGCDSELSTSAELLAVNVSEDIDYGRVYDYLIEKFEKTSADFEEACISETHQQ